MRSTVLLWTVFEAVIAHLMPKYVCPAGLRRTCCKNAVTLKGSYVLDCALSMCLGT